MTNIFYTKDHEWIKIEKEYVTVGITDFAQQQLGDIVFVDLPAIGNQLIKSEPAVVIESVKAAGEVNSPMSGAVVEVNMALDNDPELINKSSESEGWLFKMMVDDTDSNDFMDRDTYFNFIA